MTNILRGKIAFNNDLYNRILKLQEMNKQNKDRLFTYHHINILVYLMWKSSDEGGLSCSNISLTDINEFLQSKDRRYSIAKRILEDLHCAEIIALPIDFHGFIEFAKPSKKMAITLNECTDASYSASGFTYIPKALIQLHPKSISIYLAIASKHSTKFNKLSYKILMERSLITGRREFDRYLNDLINSNFILKQNCKGDKKEANSYKVNQDYFKSIRNPLPVKKYKNNNHSIKSIQDSKEIKENNELYITNKWGYEKAL